MSETGGITRLGLIKPKTNDRSIGDLEALLPGELKIELLVENMGFAYASLEEFASAMPVYDQKVAALAGRGADLIHPEGAPPFMLQGFAAESRQIAEWTERHEVPVFTTGSTQVAAMKALGVERFAGYSPFTGKLAQAFAQYYTDAGFNVLAMNKPVGDDEDVYDFTQEELRDRIISGFREIPGEPQVLYILGSGWRALDFLSDLEEATGIPVLHPVVVRCWFILSLLGWTQPIAGHGRLLAEMPPLRP